MGAMSPGPSFVVVSRIAARSSRLEGLAAALGMGLGGALFAVLALLGLAALLLQVQWLHLTLRILGGLYLVYLGIRMWRGASEPLVMSEAGCARPSSVLRSCVTGLAVQLSNPKTALVYASIFAALLPPNTPSWVLFALPPLVFMLEASWYSIVALAFSATGSKTVYMRAKTWIDRSAGLVMGALGARLISEAFAARP